MQPVTEPPGSNVITASAGGPIFHGCLGLLLVAVLALDTRAFDPTGWALLFITLLLVYALAWVLFLANWLLRRHRGTVLGGGRRFVVAPIAALVVAGLVAVHAPLRVAWTVSGPAFRREAAKLAGDGQRTAREVRRRFGVVSIRYIDELDDNGSIVFYGIDIGRSGRSGFAHLPNGSPSDLNFDGDRYLRDGEWTSLGDDWFAWEATG